MESLLSTDESAPAPVTARGILRLAETAVRSDPSHLLLVAALGPAPAILLGWGAQHLVFAAAEDASSDVVSQLEILYEASRTASMFLWMLGLLLAHAALTYGVMERLAGREASAAVMLGAAVRRLPFLLLLALPCSLAVLLGLLLLVAPGVFLLAVLLPLSAVALTERLGPIETVRRTASLTRDHRAAIAGALLAMGGAGGASCCCVFCVLAYPIVTSESGEPTLWDAPHGQLLRVAINYAASIVALITFSAIAGAAHRDLCRVKSVRQPPAES